MRTPSSPPRPGEGGARTLALSSSGRRARTRVLLGFVLAGFAAQAAATDGAGGISSTPFAPRSGPRGATLFTMLPAAETGIVVENNYADPRMWTDRYQELVYGEVGTGIAIGDYDGDGRPDVFVVSKSGQSRLFRNLGGWKFEDVTAQAGLSDPPGAGPGVWSQGATFADVNNDGRLDLYVCRFGAPNLLYLNQGDGTFREEAAARGLAVVDACGVAAFCDYDRDGALDVYIQTNLLNAATHPNGQRDYLLHNDGHGFFTNVTDRAGIAGETAGHSATWWDYDNDGWPDLYVANDYAAPDQLYHNNRDGTFTNVIDRVVPHMPYYGMGADLGDVNNDGRIDLFVADMAATTHEKDQRGMAGSRARAQQDPADPAADPQYMHNALYLNTGVGRCLEAAYLAGLAATDWTWSPRFEDLDNDGRLDLFVTNGMIREYHNADLLDRLMGAESPGEARRLVRASPKLLESHLAFRNLGDLRFENVSAAWGLDQKAVSFGSAFGDLDGDGDLDLVYANYQGGVSVLRNDSDSGHRLIVALRGTRSNRFGVGATVKIETASGIQVRQLVLARGYLSSSEPILHFGLGDDTRIQRLVVSWPSGTMQMFTDLPADRKFTIVEPAAVPAALEAAPAPPIRRLFNEVGAAVNFSLSSHEARERGEKPAGLLPMDLSHRGNALAVGDLAGDGHDDVVIGGGAGEAVRRLRGDGAGHFGAPTEVAATAGAVEDGPLLVFDADGDGANDLLVTRGGADLPAGAAAYQPVLLLNDGHGGLRPAAPGALPALPLSVGAVAAADFDRDGRLDLFIGARVLPKKYPLPPRSALLINRGGRFEDVTDTLAPGLREIGMVTSAVWSDVDGDGWPDLVIALEWGGVRYWHNNAGRGFEDRSVAAGFAAAGTGWWNSIATADFNGDGRPDFVVGNLGLNTRYRADAGHPALLYYGDFGSGGPEIIEAYHEGGRLFPWRTRNELGAEIPSILKRFPRNDAYARATLGEILGENRLAAARRFAATELRSGVFLSQPDGTYLFAPLPRIAQIAPLQGIVAGDFDGDGLADIFAVQNSYAPASSVGRFDGGLGQLLRGDGHGHFTAVPPAESGLIVPGDAKALVVVDLEGDSGPDFLVTRNRAPTLAFRNAGVAGRRELSVRLRGPAGNPTAIGARVSLELADGSRQTCEVAAGAGYFSQSSAMSFFGYTAAHPPRRLRIRWPSGETTEQAVPPDAKTLTVVERSP